MQIFHRRIQLEAPGAAMLRGEGVGKFATP